MFRLTLSYRYLYRITCLHKLFKATFKKTIKVHTEHNISDNILSITQIGFR